MKNIRSFLFFVFLSTLTIIDPLMAMKMPLSVIYPGEGIGDTRLGDKVTKVIEALEWGKPEEFRKDKQGKKFYFIYEKRGVTFIFEGEIDKATLSKIIITSPAFMTSGSGIRVGEKVDEVKNYYMKKSIYTQQNLPAIVGKCDEEGKTGNFICKEIGITFIINKKADIVEAIEVFSPNRVP